MLDDIFVGAQRDWVNPTATREKLINPFEFDAFYVWRIGEVHRAETIDTRSLSHDSQSLHAMHCAGIVGNTGWAKCRAEQVNEFLRGNSNRALHAVALAEHCDFSTGEPYWVLHVKETR